MIVSELIELLFRCDLSSEVSIGHFDYDGCSEVYREELPVVLSTSDGIVVLAPENSAKHVGYTLREISPFVEIDW